MVLSFSFLAQVTITHCKCCVTIIKHQIQYIQNQAFQARPSRPSLGWLGWLRQYCGRSLLGWEMRTCVYVVTLLDLVALESNTAIMWVRLRPTVITNVFMSVKLFDDVVAPWRHSLEWRHSYLFHDRTRLYLHACACIRMPACTNTINVELLESTT